MTGTRALFRDARRLRLTIRISYLSEEWHGQPTEKGTSEVFTPLVRLSSIRETRLWTLGQAYPTIIGSMAAYLLAVSPWSLELFVHAWARQNDSASPGPLFPDKANFGKAETASGAVTAFLTKVRR
jgi:hypothetical protein